MGVYNKREFRLKSGCPDPIAYNYDSLAIGCPDGNGNVIPNLTNCCQYEQNTVINDEIESEINVDLTIINLGDLIIDNSVDCYQPTQINDQCIVVGINNEICCTREFIGNDVFWNGINCVLSRCTPVVPEIPFCDLLLSPSRLTPETIEILSSKIECINCDNFLQWDNLYRSYNGGVGFQDSRNNIVIPNSSGMTMWDVIINLINSGGSFYVYKDNGQLILNERCCNAIPQLNKPSDYIIVYSEDVEITPQVPIDIQINGNTEQANQVIRNDIRNRGNLDANVTTTNYGFCACQDSVITPIYYGHCVDTLQEFNQIIQTPLTSGSLLNYTTLFSLGLTDEQITSILLNTQNGLLLPSDQILIHNSLVYTDGVMVAKSPEGTPKFIRIESSSDCSTYGGYWDGSTCMCNIQSDNCPLDIDEIDISYTYDIFNNLVETIVVKETGVPLDRDCCLELKRDFNLPWVYLNNTCYATQPPSCTNLKFKLNDKLIRPNCNSGNLEVSLFLYFSKPKNSCEPIIDDSDVIIIDDDESCEIVIDDQGNVVQISDITPKIRINQTFEPALEDQNRPNPNSNSNTPNSSASTPTCCYTESNPINGIITIEGLNFNVTQLQTYTSTVNGFDRWVEIKAIITKVIDNNPAEPIVNGEFDLYLEFTSGLNCCCEYDIFIDNIQINCNTPEEVTLTTEFQCPGFEIDRIIDNKKSWVYNPGLSNVGTSEFDVVTRSLGEYGLLNGHGNVNRTFSPSSDADLPFRYTNYYQQFGVVERHTDLVINSKELMLTFNMCTNLSGACPTGYVVSGDTNVCYRINVDCPSGYTLNNGYCYSGITTASTITETLIAGRDEFSCIPRMNLLQLEGYKKVFQSFWSKLIEQFVPATTIFVSGEKWCNRAEDICTSIDICDYDYELVESESSVVIVEGELPQPDPTIKYISDGGIVNDEAERIGDSINTDGSEYAYPETQPYIDYPGLRYRPLENDYGSVNVTNLVIDNLDERNVDMTGYRSTFIPRITQTTTN